MIFVGYSDRFDTSCFSKSYETFQSAQQNLNKKKKKHTFESPE